MQCTIKYPVMYHYFHCLCKENIRIKNKMKKHLRKFNSKVTIENLSDKRDLFYNVLKTCSYNGQNNNFVFQVITLGVFAKAVKC